MSTCCSTCDCDPCECSCGPVVCKAGDTLVLSGRLAGGAPANDVAWTDATAVIIITDPSGTKYVDRGEVLITYDGTYRRYLYSGEEIADDDVGFYTYEIEVTFVTTSPPTVLTFPNDNRNYRLRIVAQRG